MRSSRLCLMPEAYGSSGIDGPPGPEKWVVAAKDVGGGWEARDMGLMLVDRGGSAGGDCDDGNRERESKSTLDPMLSR